MHSVVVAASDTTDTGVECEECGGPVTDSAHYSAEEWGVCEACFAGLSLRKQSALIDAITDEADGE